MVFRLPTPFDAIAPPQSTGRRSSRGHPWRGTFILHGIDLHYAFDGQQRLFVASAETEGDKSSRTDLWPKQFDVQVAQPACRLSDVHAWVTRNDIPLCMFMPDRHTAGGTGSPTSAANESHFRNLSRLMSGNRLLCIASWPIPGSEGHGGASILILPNAASTGILIGAVFLSTPFPDFMGLAAGRPGASTSFVPSGLSASSESFGNSDPIYPNTYTSFMGHSAIGTAQGQGREHGQGQGQGSAGLLRNDSPGQLVSPYAVATHADANALANYTKPQPDGFSGDGALRAALAAAPFEWSMFDTTDGSGSTSPGSTRTW